jgi:FkbM family methyltransferase
MMNKIRRTASLIKRHIVSPPTPPAVTLAKIFTGMPAVVVQVGSNDGLQGDPISELIRENPAWRVLFIEPLPHLFRRLTANYPANPNHSFEKVAIASERGTRLMYYVSDAIKNAMTDVPYWYDQLGSFDIGHLLKHGDKFAPFIISEEVQCEPLADTLTRNGITDIDLLHIDTEGYDFKILEQVIPSTAPRAVLYEHRHLSRREQSDARKLLRDAGYRTCRVTISDTLALKT